MKRRLPLACAVSLSWYSLRRWFSRETEATVRMDDAASHAKEAASVDSLVRFSMRVRARKRKYPQPSMSGMVAVQTKASFHPKARPTTMAMRTVAKEVKMVPRVEPLRPARRLASVERKFASAPDVTESPSKNSMSWND
jgi:hypothetical protein